MAWIIMCLMERAILSSMEYSPSPLEVRPVLATRRQSLQTTSIVSVAKGIHIARAVSADNRITRVQTVMAGIQTNIARAVTAETQITRVHTVMAGIQTKDV